MLPSGFMRVRHFGFLANLSACDAQAGRAKKRALPRCRKVLGINPALPTIPDRSAHDLLREITGIDISRCPACKLGTMIVVGELPRISHSPRWDSS